MILNIKEEKIDHCFPNPTIKGNPTVFIGTYTIGEKELQKICCERTRELFLYGTIVKSGEVHLQFGELKHVEFVVLEKVHGSDAFIEHFLSQNKSVMYKKDSDDTDSECVDMLKKSDIRYLHTPPGWNMSEASIPKKDDEMFYFLKQFYLPENAITKEYLTWDETVYLFALPTENDALIIQVFTQDTSAQTAEDHYKLEALISSFDKNFHDVEAVKKLIKEGDKYFHEYALNHKKTDENTLNILLQHAQTKALKSKIEKKLNISDNDKKSI